MTARVTIDADPVAARALEDAMTGEMAADLLSAGVDLDRDDLCKAALIEARHPSGAVERLLDDARRIAAETLA